MPHHKSLNVPKLMPILIYFVFIQFNGAKVPKIYMEKVQISLPIWSFYSSLYTEVQLFILAANHNLTTLI